MNPFSLDLLGDCVQNNLPIIMYSDRSINKDFISVLKQIHDKFNYNFVQIYNDMKDYS